MSLADATHSGSRMMTPILIPMPLRRLPPERPYLRIHGCARSRSCALQHRIAQARPAVRKNMHASPLDRLRHHQCDRETCKGSCSIRRPVDGLHFPATGSLWRVIVQALQGGSTGRLYRPASVLQASSKVCKDPTNGIVLS